MSKVKKEELIKQVDGLEGLERLLERIIGTLKLGQVSVTKNIEKKEEEPENLFKKRPGIQNRFEYSMTASINEEQAYIMSKTMKKLEKILDRKITANQAMRFMILLFNCFFKQDEKWMENLLKEERFFTYFIKEMF